jgi:hypothetical protein
MLKMLHYHWQQQRWWWWQLPFSQLPLLQETHKQTGFRSVVFLNLGLLELDIAFCLQQQRQHLKLRDREGQTPS